MFVSADDLSLQNVEDIDSEDNNFENTSEEEKRRRNKLNKLKVGK